MTTITNRRSDALLRTALRINGAFSGTCGLIASIASGGVSEAFGIEEASILSLMNGQAFVFLIGLGLIVFAFDLFWLASRPTIHEGLAWLIIGADLAWVMISWIMLVGNALPFSQAGGWTVLILSDIVLIFAIVQWVGLKRMTQEQSASG